MIHTVTFLEFRYFRLLVIHVSKYHCTVSTSCRTSGLEFSVFNFTTISLRVQNSLLCFLNTHRTFFHHATRTYIYIWIHHHFTQVVIHVIVKLVIVIVQEPVKTSHFIRTVIGTITCSYTTVIRHMVLTLSRVRCCSYRTNCLTWCMVTVLTHYRLESHLRIDRRIFQFSKTS